MYSSNYPYLVDGRGGSENNGCYKDDINYLYIIYMMYIIYTMLYIIYLGKQKIFSQFQFQNSQERLIDALVWGKGGWLA